MFWATVGGRGGGNGWRRAANIRISERTRKEEEEDEEEYEKEDEDNNDRREG